MKEFDVWDAASMVWTEIGLDDEDYRDYAKKLANNFSSWHDVDKIIKQDVSGAFAPTSAGMLLAIIPIVGIFVMALIPDWGYDDNYLKNKIENWHSRAKWTHFLNPFRIIGYPIALLMVNGFRKKLKEEFIRAKGNY